MDASFLYEILILCWCMSGTLHDGGGMTTAFTMSGIMGSDTADSIINCTNIKRTRYYKEVWVAALEILKKRGYNEYLINISEEQPLCYVDWEEDICKQQPQADYYSKCQELDLTILEVISKGIGRIKMLIFSFNSMLLGISFIIMNLISFAD